MGAAIAQLFAFTLAASSTKMESITTVIKDKSAIASTSQSSLQQQQPPPISVITLGAPKVGNHYWFNAFQSLERKGTLKHICISNDDDDITIMPLSKQYKPTAGINFHLNHGSNGKIQLDVGYTNEEKQPSKNIAISYHGFNNNDVAHRLSTYWQRLNYLKGNRILSKSIDELYNEYYCSEPLQKQEQKQHRKEQQEERHHHKEQQGQGQKQHQEEQRHQNKQERYEKVAFTKQQDHKQNCNRITMNKKKLTKVEKMYWNHRHVIINKSTSVAKKAHLEQMYLDFLSLE